MTFWQTVMNDSRKTDLSKLTNEMQLWSMDLVQGCWSSQIDTGQFMIYESRFIICVTTGCVAIWSMENWISLNIQGSRGQLWWFQRYSAVLPIKVVSKLGVVFTLNMFPLKLCILLQVCWSKTINANWQHTFMLKFTIYVHLYLIRPTLLKRWAQKQLW